MCLKTNTENLSGPLSVFESIFITEITCGGSTSLGCFPTQTKALLFTQQTFWEEHETTSSDCCLIMASSDKHATSSLSSNIHLPLCQTDFIRLTHTFLTTFLSHLVSLCHTHTPFGCNKTADQSHWLLTGTDTETCCCWKAAWEMFITHKACRFGQERNNGLIKWRPGAAVGEIHTHTPTCAPMRSTERVLTLRL